ncbi:FAD-binding oxidoreductase [Rhodococcus erythropolis]|uniref:FAD-binding oxidoreductase n=1 Tax=Rhodococcus erythropolis TaxID=1833 RepID=UPI000687A450|nr:FAD-binding oxidoreductase [Rhodococcus erythropolis]
MRKGDGLDPTVIARLQSSLDSLTDDEESRAHFSAVFYTGLFAEHPLYRSLFPAGMESQGHRFFRAIEFVVKNLPQHRRIRKFLTQLGRDHRRYGVEREHYEAAGVALERAVRSMYGTSAHSRYKWTPELDEAWSQFTDLVVSTMADGAESDTTPALWGATVVSHERVLDDLAIVRLEADPPIPYGAGQYVGVQIPQRPKMWRYYSPAIPTNPFGQLEFHIRKVSGGWVSPAIVSETNVGDRWVMSTPLGGLEVDFTSDRDVLMIGSGTGIAPLRAQVMEMSQRANNPRVHLFVGGRYPCDLYDLETLWHISLSNPWLTVVPVSEEPENPWWHNGPVLEPPFGMHSRLIGPIGKVVAQFGSWADRQVQISGSPSMIKTTVYALRAGGTPLDQIRHDPLY